MKTQITTNDRNLYFGDDNFNLNYELENKIIKMINCHLEKHRHNIITFQENGIIVIPCTIETILDIKRDFFDKGKFYFYSDFKDVLMISGLSSSELPLSISLISCNNIIYHNSETPIFDISDVYNIKNISMKTFLENYC
jgi:hypothetical protein